MTYRRQYGVAASVAFPLIVAGSTSFAASSAYTHSSGDVKISKDNGAAATAACAPVALTMGNGNIWYLPLTATEMQAGTVVVTIIDAATKAVEDQMIVIETYGSSVGQLVLNDWADALLERDMSQASTASSVRSPYSALAALRNKVDGSGASLIVYHTDDVTAAWSATLTGSSSASIITTIDPG